MIEDTRKGMGLWVLAGLLVLAILGTGIWGAMRLSALSVAPGWYASMDGAQIEPVQPEGAEEGHDYYRLRFVLTNNSDQDGYFLAQLYVQDGRFTAYYDREVPGCARFLCGAVCRWAGQD